jgi:hypothetical protein
LEFFTENKKRQINFHPNLSDDNLHINQLLIRQNVFEILNVLDSEAKLGGIGIIGENVDDASGEGKHHVAGHLNLASRFIAASVDGKEIH